MTKQISYTKQSCEGLTFFRMRKHGYEVSVAVAPIELLVGRQRVAQRLRDARRLLHRMVAGWA